MITASQHSRSPLAGVSLGNSSLGSVGSTLLSIAWPASVAASAYHGYKRNRSVGWAVAWGLLGGLFPIITPAIAVGQGFGRRA